MGSTAMSVPGSAPVSSSESTAAAGRGRRPRSHTIYGGGASYTTQKHLEQNSQSMLDSIHKRGLILAINDDTGNFRLLKDMLAESSDFAESFFKSKLVQNYTDKPSYVLIPVVHLAARRHTVFPPPLPMPDASSEVISSGPGWVPPATVTMELPTLSPATSTPDLHSSYGRVVYGEEPEPSADLSSRPVAFNLDDLSSSSSDDDDDDEEEEDNRDPVTPIVRRRTHAWDAWHYDEEPFLLSPDAVVTTGTGSPTHEEIRRLAVATTQAVEAVAAAGVAAPPQPSFY